MSEERSLQEICRGNAQVFASAMKDTYNVELQCDRTGAEWLDRFIQSRSEVLDTETLSGLIELIGCFFGECIIHEYGGGWADQDQPRRVRINGHEEVDPFWMAESCLRYRSAYALSGLFAAVPTIAKIRMGGLYATRSEEGGFSVYKVLAVDHMGVHLRKYGNRFKECPSHIDPTSLSIGLDFAAWQQRGGPAFELPIGHFPLAHDGFWEMDPVLVQVEPVADDELDGYCMWLTGNSPEEAGPPQPLEQEAAPKKWWQFWR